jgi:multiple sugar transport system ATP-binding protein
VAEIRVEHLHKAFADFVAVQGSTFTIANGEFFCLLGPSGCGKTTTLRMIAGLELPTSGRILLDGEDVSFRRAAQRDIAFVFQLFALYPHMSVRQNIGFPLKSQGMRRAEIRERVAQAAQTLRIMHLLEIAPCQACPPATGSAWPWAAPSCASQRPSSWTSLSVLWIRSSGTS